MDERAARARRGPTAARPLAVLVSVALACAAAAQSGSPPPGPAAARAPGAAPSAPPPGPAAAPAPAVAPAVVAGRWTVNGDHGRIVTVEQRRFLVLTGNVSAHRTGVTLTADHARRDMDREETFLVGAVHAVSESLTVWADSVEVIERADLARAFGSVKLQTLEGTTGTGARGILRRSDRWLALAGDARMIDGAIVVDADSLTYDRAAGVLQAFGAVRIVDGANQTLITGARARFDRRSGLAWVDSLPHLTSRRQGQRLAEVESRRMVFQRDGSRRRAVGAVRFRQGATSATADSADFQGDSLLVLTGTPRVEQGRQALTGERASFFYEGGELRRIDVFGQTELVDSSPDTLRRIFTAVPLANQLRGDTLSIDVVHDEVTHTRVRGSARSTYLPEDQSSTISVNEVSGSAIDISFLSGHVDRVDVHGQVEGAYRFLERKRMAAAASADSSAAVRGEPHAAAHADSSSAAPPAAPRATAVADTAAVRTRGAGGDSTAARIDFDAHAEKVLYKGKRASFAVPRGLILISGDAEVQHGTLTLGSQEIHFDTNARELLAEGDPLLKDKESELLGDRMGYLFDPQTGAVAEGGTRYQDGFYYGKHVRRLDEKTLLVRDATYTSCDLAEPHYHFTAKRMRLRLNEQVVARQVTFYVSDLPVLPLPFYFKSLDSGRHSGILFPRVDVGVSSREGRYIRDLGYYWATNDYTDFTFQLDYNERKDFTLALSNRYRVRYGMDGQVSFSYLRAFGVKLGETRGDEWRLTAHHNQPNLWEVWNAGADVSASSQNLTRNNLNSDARRDLLPTQLRSTGRLSRTFGSGVNLSLSGSRDQFVNAGDGDPLTDKQLSRTTLPAATLGFKTGPLLPPLHGDELGTPITNVLRDIQFSQSYRGQLDQTRSENTQQDAIGAGGAYRLAYAPKGRLWLFAFTSSAGFGFDYNRTSTHQSLYAVFSDTTLVPRPGLPDSLVVTQSVRLREHRDDLRDKVTPNLSFTNSLRTDLYGIFRTRLGPVTGIKHKVTWSMGHSFSPQLGAKQSRSQRFNFGLDNELSVKLRAAHALADTGRAGARAGADTSLGTGASERADATGSSRIPGAAGVASDASGSGPQPDKEASRKLDQLVRWSLAASYDPEAAAGAEWSPITSTVTVQPIGGRLVNLVVSHQLDPHDLHVLSSQSTIQGNLHLGGDLDLGGALLQRKERLSPVLQRIPARGDSAREGQAAAGEGSHPQGAGWGGDEESGSFGVHGSHDRNRLPWSVDLRYSYLQSSAGASTPTHVNADGNVALPGAWSLHYSTELDVSRGQFTNQYYSLRRDIHCWALEFDRSVDGGGSEFGFRLYLKQIPDLKVTRGHQGVGGGYGQVFGY
jgi:lipopolysaccharide assembly outer membrane protein LptD (OstA)